MWDDAKHIYPKDTKYKSKEWRDTHKNMFMNLLITYLLVLKNEANYIIDDFVPESVQKRSLAYLQESFDIHHYFMHLFEKRREDVSYSKDEDWSISKVVKTIRASDVFTSLTRREQYSKELSVGSMKEFFKTNAFYKKYVHVNSSTKKITLRGWRLKVIDGDED